jgi:hypothetical protein
LTRLECKRRLVLAATPALFRLGNGAMLPLYGLAVVAAYQGDVAAFVATIIIVNQTISVGE